MNRIIISFIIISSVIYGQSSIDTLHCNHEILMEFHNNVDSLDIQIAEKFLLTFDEKCFNNVEYSEWSNALLYKFLDVNPQMLIELLSAEGSYNIGYICKNLEEPIHDGFDLKSIFEKVEKVNIESVIKEKVLKSIRIAINNY